MAEYDSAKALATRLIAKKGRNVTLRQRTETALADTDKPWEPSPVSTTDTTVKAVMVPYNRKQVDGTLIRINDQLCYISAEALGTDPSKKDIIVDGAREYRIMDIEELAPGEQTVLYTLQLRG